MPYASLTTHRAAIRRSFARTRTAFISSTVTSRISAGTEPAEIREVTVEEMKAVLVRANERRMAARWVVRLAYGIRQGECLGLSWDDVDFDAGVLRIRQQLQR